MTDLAIIDPRDIVTNQDITSVIGRGNFGAVRLCTTKELGRIAVKCYQLVAVGKELKLRKERIENEAYTLLMLSHKNIIKIHGVSSWSNSFGILTEYMPGGNLDQFLSNKNISDIPYCIRLRIAEELSEAINFLHGGNLNGVYVHGDIKPENILLSLDLTVKLADFGSINIAACTGATALTENLPKTKQYTPFYTAPEFLKNVHQSRKPTMDVYSFGMVLYEILTRKRVFENASLPPQTILQVICDKDQKPDLLPFKGIKEKLSEEDLPTFNLLFEIMNKSWSKERDDRPKMDKVQTALFEKLEAKNKEAIEQKVSQLVKAINFQLIRVDEECCISLDHFRFPFEQFSVPFSTSASHGSISHGIFAEDKSVPLTNRFLIEASNATSSKVDTHAIKSKSLGLGGDTSLDDVLARDTSQPVEEVISDVTSLLPNVNTHLDGRQVASRAPSNCAKKPKVVVSVVVVTLLLLTSIGIGLYFRFSPSSDQGCPELSLSPNVTMSCTDGKNVRSVCYFKCPKAKKLKGQFIIVCQPSLKWSDVPPTCNDSCPACFTGPTCEESISWSKLKSFVQNITPNEESFEGYAGNIIACIPQAHGNVFLKVDLDCTCRDISSSVSVRCNNYPSGSASCEHALAQLVRDMNSRGIYPKPCDVKSMTVGCN